MADKQFMKGAVTGVLCASLVLGGGYVGLQKAGRAESNVLSDVAVTQRSQEIPFRKRFSLWYIPWMAGTVLLICFPLSTAM